MDQTATLNEPRHRDKSKLIDRQQGLRLIRIGFWLLASVLGFLHVWADPHYLTNADAMSYLDIADAYLQKDWKTAINSYWSPLYSWLIALALLAFDPSPYWRFAVLHLTNLGIFLFGLACFDFMLRQFILLDREFVKNQRGFGILPDWAWFALGYSLYIWVSLLLIGVSLESPDLLVASLVYLAFGFVLRIRLFPHHWLPFALLGLTLGFAYLAKAVMFPLSFVFLLVALFSVGNLRRALPRFLLALVAFGMVAGPFILAISKEKGRLTFGESGRLNYIWATNGIFHIHWQGEESANGVPRHPTRKIFANPHIYEFGEPIRGTYPVWYDPTYWYEGLVGRLDVGGVIRSSGKGVRAYYELFFGNVQFGLSLGFLTLLVLSRRRWKLVLDLASRWFLIVPALSGMGIYSIISVQGRYLGPFLILLWLALFSTLNLPDRPESRKVITSITGVLASLILITVTASSGREAFATFRTLIASQNASKHEQWQVAEGLKELGVAPGDRVAVIGDTFRAFWAHLARVRIVAEIQNRDSHTFWSANASVRNQALESLASTGARVVVTERSELFPELTSWKKIGNTDYYVYLLASETGIAAPQHKGSSDK